MGAHFVAAGSELHEWDNGEWQLQAEDYLAEDEQLAGSALPIEQDHDNGWRNGERAGGQSPLPGQIGRAHV